MHGALRDCLGLGLGLVLALSGVHAASAEPASGTIQVSLSSDIRSTNPGVNRDANTDTVMMHVLEGLVGYREDGSPGLLLAESIDVSADGLAYTFRLRSGVHFHNGATLGAEDVVWSWRRYLDPGTGWECLGEFDGSRGNKIESVESTGADTVVFRLNRPQPMLLTQMAATQCGGSAIVHRDSLGADGSWRAPIATGPYRLSSWERGRHIDLEAFDGYSSREGPRDGYTGAKAAYARTIRFLIIHDAAARLAALVKGQLDVMPEVPAAQMVQLRRLAEVKLSSRPMLVNYLILIQSHDPVMADVRMRRALDLSLERQPIASLVTEGVGVANASLIPVASPFHSAQQAIENGHDQERARELLAEAGYDGRALVLATNRRYPAMYNQALLVQALARRSGINIQLEVLEWATQLDRWKSGSYQLMSFGFSARTDPYFNYDAIVGDYQTSRTKIWNNPEAIALCRASALTADPAQRQAMFDRLHALMLQDVPALVLYSLSDVNAVRSDIQGFDSWALGRTRLWGVQRLAGTR